MDLHELLTSRLHDPWWEMLAKLLFAVISAAVIGWEREAAGRAAGLRTHILVGLGAAGLAITALETPAVFSSVDGADAVSVDPTRILAAVIGGIGFLGGGAIIQARGKVRGLTTAAGLWVTAAIGLSVGLGLFTLAVVMAGFAIITLTWLRRIEHQAPSLSGNDAANDDDEGDRDGEGD